MKTANKEKKILILPLIFLITTTLALLIYAAFLRFTGIHVQLMTDKKEYRTDEEIVINLSAKNANNFDIENMVLHTVMPDGLDINPVTENTIHRNTLDAGKTLNLSFTAKSGVAIPAKNSETSQLTKTKTTPAIPIGTAKIQTVLLMMAWIIIVVAFTHSIIKNGKEKSRKLLIPIYITFFMSAILFWTQTTFAASGNAGRVRNSNKDAYAELEKEIIVDGKPYIIKGQMAHGTIENINLKVIFEQEDGTILSNQKVSYGDDAKAPEPPEKEGYTFSEWSSNLTNITKDMVIRPEYTRNQYSVVFKNKDDEVVSEQLIYHGEDAQAPEPPAVEGHTFIAWDQPYTNVTSEVIVKAQYEINTYKVVFKGSDGSVLSETTVTHGATAKAPTAPARKGYTFAGWDKSFHTVTTNLEITALYKKNAEEAKPAASPTTKTPGSPNSSGKNSNKNSAGKPGGKPPAPPTGGGSPPPSNNGGGTTVPGTYSDAEARQVFELMNADRAAKGLHRLTWDSQLAGYAKTRAAELYISPSHTRPNGSNCFSMSSRIRGENIAGGQHSAQVVYNAWYASSGHYKNMFHSSFKYVGIAKISVPGSEYRYYWVQIFG